MGRGFVIIAALAGCNGAGPTVEVQGQGGPTPIICTRKNTMDMCRDGAGGFWICDGLSHASCLRITEPADAFTVKPQPIEAVKP